MFKSNQEKQVQIQVLQDFFTGQEDGASLSWLEIQGGTGVDMGKYGPGRAMARTALVRLHRAYETLQGRGIRLSSAENSLLIVGGRLRRVSRQVTLGKRVLGFISTRHRSQLTGEEGVKLDIAASCLGALESARSMTRGSMFRRREPTVLPPAKPVVPGVLKTG